MTIAANLKFMRMDISLSMSCLLVLSHLLIIVRRLVNPYVQPVLYVRRPGNDHEEVHKFPDDDPFFSEVWDLPLH